jgi:hypothetical protein
MKLRKFVSIALVSLSFIIVASACSTLQGGKPSAVISSPPSGSTYHEGDDVAIQSTSGDQAGVVRVELTIDGVVTRNDTPPSPQTSFTIIETWKAAQGPHTVIVRAYNAAGAASDPAAISISVSVPAAGSTSVPTQAPPPTAVAQQPTAIPPTEVPPTTAPADCTNNAAFVADVTVPDGTLWAPGQAFNKIWRVKNTGTCAWTSAYDFAFVTGEAMATTTAIAVPSTAPGATADLLVAMAAPTTVGAHSGQWKLRTVADSFFGGPMTVSIKVINPSAPPAQPPAQPAAQPPASSGGCTGTPVISSFFVSAPTAVSNAAITVDAGTTVQLGWGQVMNADSVEVDHGIGDVAAPGSATDTPGSSTTYTLSAHCGSNTKTAQVSVTVSAGSPLHLVTVAPPVYHLLIFKVTSASVSKTCDPGNIKTNFAGTITANGSGNVTYRWEDDNGSRGGTYSLSFGAAGTQSTMSTYRVHAGSGTIYIHVLTPNDLQSGGKTFNPTCP